MYFYYVLTYSFPAKSTTGEIGSEKWVELPLNWSLELELGREKFQFHPKFEQKKKLFLLPPETYLTPVSITLWNSIL